MPCIRIPNGMLCTLDDGKIYQGEAMGRTWRWTFHPWMGPLMVDKNGNEKDPPPRERHPFWIAFNKWFKTSKYARKSCQR